MDDPRITPSKLSPIHVCCGAMFGRVTFEGRWLTFGIFACPGRKLAIGMDRNE